MCGRDVPRPGGDLHDVEAVADLAVEKVDLGHVDGDGDGRELVAEHLDRDVDLGDELRRFRELDDERRVVASQDGGGRREGEDGHEGQEHVTHEFLL